MTWRTPTDPGGPGPASIPGDPGERPSALAELEIILLPVGDGHAISWRQGSRAIAWSLRFLTRTRGRRAYARFAPSWCAAELLWAATVIGTLAITAPTGVPYQAIALILAIELTGFAVCAIWRRRHDQSRSPR